MKNRIVGIAIPAHNEEENIGTLLDSIYAQTLPKKYIRTYIANNASTDHTKQIITSFQITHSDLQIYVTKQPIRGIAPTRKKALDLATKNKSHYLLNVDADCILPSNLLVDSLSILGNKQNALVSYPLIYSKLFLLILHTQYRPLKRVIAILTTIQEQLLGPSIYTGCLLLPTSLYKKIYWNDVLDPIIPDDDFLLSRRLNGLGVQFLRSTIEVQTSDRRFLGNQELWANHDHTRDYRQSSIAINRPTTSQMQSAISLRIEKARDRLLQSVVEYMFLASLPHSPYIHAKELALFAMRKLHIPLHRFQSVHLSQKHAYFQFLKSEYGPDIITFLQQKIGKLNI